MNIRWSDNKWKQIKFMPNTITCEPLNGKDTLDIKQSKQLTKQQNAILILSITSVVNNPQLSKSTTPLSNPPLF